MDLIADLPPRPADGHFRMKFSDVMGSPVVRTNTCEFITEDGWSRLHIATSDSRVGLMMELVNEWSPPFFVLYEHIVPRTDHPAGRYQSPLIKNLPELKVFLSHYKDLFEGDGRQNIWVAAPNENRRIIYDRHKILYLYGDDQRVANHLKEWGFEQEQIEIPVPHSHHYNVENDTIVIDLMSYWDWSYSPLPEGDD